MHTNKILPQFSYLGLLLFLAFFFVVSPFFSEGAYARLVLNLSVVSLLILSVYICSDSKKYLAIAIILAAPTLVRLVYPTVEVDEVTYGFNACFFAFVIYVLLRKLFRTSQVTADVIYAAISVYLLIGVFWGIVYTLLEYIWSGSFSLVPTLHDTGFDAEFNQSMLYYSFITLTTVGYGDILSISQPAKFLSALEAMTGQIYLTVLVARLVGMHIAQSKT